MFLGKLFIISFSSSLLIPTFETVSSFEGSGVGRVITKGNLFFFEKKFFLYNFFFFFFFFKTFFFFFKFYEIMK